MKAILMREPGGPEVLQLVDLPQPEITTPTEVRVRLHAAGVNPVDTKIRKRGPLLPGTLTAVPGCDGAGVVEAVGAGVTRFRPGDAVWFCHGGLGGPRGNYAEYTVVDESIAQPKPASLDFVQAAAAPLVLITAWEALFDRAGLDRANLDRAGLDRTGGGAAGSASGSVSGSAAPLVLIHAGAGGVGHIAIQLARLAGARVAATVSGPDKAAFVHGLGAECAINYREEDLVGAVANWTEGRGVDLVFDTVGPEVLRRSIPVLAVYGDLVTILDPGPNLDLGEARNRNLRLSLELMLTPQLRGIPSALAAQGALLRRCGELFDADKLHIEVAGTYPLARAAEAHRLLEAGGMQGKLVLTID